MNLLMLSGDASVAQGRDSTFGQMLERFSTYWQRIDIICPRAAGATARTVYTNVHLHPSPWHVALQPWFIARRGGRLVAERRYALMVSHDFGFFYNGVGAWWLSRRAGLPYVSEIHHVEGYPRAATHRERLYRALAKRYIRRVHSRPQLAAIRTVNTVEVPALLRELGVPEDKILVLPSLYIDFETFLPMPDEPRCYDVLFVGRLAHNKGLFTLLEALARVRQTRPAVRLGILGEGPLWPALEKRIAALGLQGNITRIARVSTSADVARLYNQAKMLVCASTAEGGPRVTVEAMACGVPVISTPVGIMRELVEDGANGLIFQWEAAELADKICLLLDEAPRRAKIAEAGRQSVQCFRADRVVEQYARGYHELIRRLPPDPNYPDY